MDTQSIIHFGRIHKTQSFDNVIASEIEILTHDKAHLLHRNILNVGMESIHLV